MPKHAQTKSRSGPVPFDDDSWDAAPAPFRPPEDRPVRTRRMSVTAAVVVGLVLAVTVGAAWVFGGRPRPEWAGRGQDWTGEASSVQGSGEGDRGRATQRPPASAAPNPGAAGSGAGTAGPTGASGPAGATASDSAAAAAPWPGDSTSSSAASPAPSPLPPVFVQSEAEAGSPRIRLRNADVVAQSGASGGQVVRFVGASGDIEFRLLSTVVSGTYRLTIEYLPNPALVVAMTLVSVDGGGPVVVDLDGTGCCATATVDITLPLGTHVITLAGSADWTPPIDRLTLADIG